jgi:hypothetical protein
MKGKIEYPSENRIEELRDEADFALMNATAMFILALRSQETLFSLGLESELDACEKDVIQVWMPIRTKAIEISSLYSFE